MANIKIENLPPAIGLDGTERIPIAKQSGGNYATQYTTTGAIALAAMQGAVWTLPTTRPATPGMLWNNAGVLSIS